MPPIQTAWNKPLCHLSHLHPASLVRSQPRFNKQPAPFWADKEFLMKRMGALRVRDTGAPRFAAVTDSEIVQRVASAASATVLRLWTTVASAVAH